MSGSYSDYEDDFEAIDDDDVRGKIPVEVMSVHISTIYMVYFPPLHNNINVLS